MNTSIFIKSFWWMLAFIVLANITALVIRDMPALGILIDFALATAGTIIVAGAASDKR